MKLEELIGNTPLIELESIPVNKNVTIYCKLEGQNPGGSVKDRAALGDDQWSAGAGRYQTWRYAGGGNKRQYRNCFGNDRFH